MRRLLTFLEFTDTFHTHFTYVKPKKGNFQGNSKVYLKSALLRSAVLHTLLIHFPNTIFDRLGVASVIHSRILSSNVMLRDVPLEALPSPSPCSTRATPMARLVSRLQSPAEYALFAHPTGGGPIGLASLAHLS